MPSSKQPEILLPGTPEQPSRLGSAAGIFTNQNLDRLAHILDDCFRIPGTPIRFGLDGIVGLVPAIGDVLAGLASCILIFAAWVRGVPYITLVRMLVNLALDVVIGAIPFLGDAFDIAWKANRRNYALLVRHIEQPTRHAWKDWFFLGILVLAIIAIFLVPLLVLAWMLDWFFHHL
ncbi:hypothetical protein ACPOL_3191 [Acidisarcina polymorpha]|uniref:DUF4112 domain-containing protein n=2 Tax=Acidisarcina polymorpha TaxID=2211140 RepID=A0A2Z5G1P2_9BACT|nr:hypothetical protein ACPOL_3191 [Acidisarcina polymorpha]